MASGKDDSPQKKDDSAEKNADIDDQSSDDAASDEVDTEETPNEPADKPEPVDPGETLFYEPGGSWWVVAIGPVLIIATLVMEILGKGRIHWEVLTIFGVVLIGFSILQVFAARQHVSVTLTETTLTQGAETVALADIVKIFPENHGNETYEWESARALGELPAVPRRRRGIGVRLKSGKLAQAWARDVDRLRAELTEAHLAVKMGLPPKGRS
ncbi:DUF3093 domain-containing protein [Gordonia sp. (in: high G+C Gram-positive bacteria)]|uniref:DUF3093 domain-containing protein n=1 Tax=Gordonia sp. (in: high G+C Gram-positive bacteria) TaxID=84139 RepID=UPI003C791F0D